jgi:putative DNA methylase
MSNVRLIETDNFDFEFLSGLAERESWRKEIYRPIYHLHKWWAKRLGSVFRGILLGSLLPDDQTVSENFYSHQDFASLSVFDPFMGSGTTIGEAHKLGLTALGRDINPVAVESVRIAFGPMDKRKLDEEFSRLALTVGKKLLSLYQSTDSAGNSCDVLYYFWVMQVGCPTCEKLVDLFPTWIIARNAYPDRKPEIQVLCPRCRDVFPSTNGKDQISCPSCSLAYDPHTGNATGSKASCPFCRNSFSILSAVPKSTRPHFRLYAKLVLTSNGAKEYLKVNDADVQAFESSSKRLKEEIRNGALTMPDTPLDHGYNTKQAISYGFRTWTDFFNDRQLLGLAWLNRAISEIEDDNTRDIFLLAFSGLLEFSNMFASYKGEGTGAVRHMFSHHILKPERTPIEANIWGTSKSSGSFLNVFRNRVYRALEYRMRPTEVNEVPGKNGDVWSFPFSGRIEQQWPSANIDLSRRIYLSCGDSGRSNLPAKSVALVVTDPPFFDNVHYSELADFFYSWQTLTPRGFIKPLRTTRSAQEVQDSDASDFTRKLTAVFKECHRVLRDDGLLVFTYHHSRDEGWQSVAQAILDAGFVVVNAHPVKSEMSVATPKAQANEPIQVDMIIVCRKAAGEISKKESTEQALRISDEKIARLERSGLSLSKNDRKVIRFGQLLSCLRTHQDVIDLPLQVAPSGDLAHH